MKCPFCHEISFAKKQNVMDGWTVTGTIEVCALCGRELPRVSAPSPDDTAGKKRNALAALLGGEEVEKVTLSGDDADFCHNCVNFIEHPFHTRCGLNGSSADPMGSCENFSRRK